jgi:uncharacterized protein
MKIVIAGGMGWIGSALVRALAADGHEIVVLSRSARPAAPGLRIVQWDGRSLGPWTSEIDGANAVINLAGESVAAHRWMAARKRVLYASRIEPNRVLVTAITNAARRPVVFANASAVGYYGDRGDAPLTETDPPGEGFLAKLVVDWEAATRDAPIRTIQLRTGVVIGPASDVLTRMAPAFRWFVGGPIGSGRQWFPWVHRDDVIGIVRFALAHPDVAGPVNVLAPEPVRNGEFARALGRIMHRPASVPVPALALRLLFGELAGALLGSQRVVPTRALAAGYTFDYPSLMPALADSLESQT